MEKKIILDSNIWVSYFISHKFAEITKIILGNDFQVYACEELLNEMKNVLARKKFINKITLPINFYINLIQSLTKEVTIKLEFNNSPDVKDDYLFDLAKQTNSKILVTGDKKLLHFKNEIVTVISLKEFLENIKN